MRSNKAHREIDVGGERWKVTLNGTSISFRQHRRKQVFTVSLVDLCETATGQLHLGLNSMALKKPVP
jgi:hypothetical protein